MPKRYYVGPEYTQQQAAGWLSELKGNTIGLDIETTGLVPQDGEILLLQLSDGETTLVIDGSHLVSGGLVLHALHERFFSGRVLLVGHNLSFEHKWLGHHANLRVERCFDTRWSHLAIYNGTVHANESNLGYVTYVATGRTREDKKDMQMSFVMSGAEAEAFVPSAEQIDYAAIDAEDVLEIMQAHLPKIEEKGLRQALKLRFDMVPVVGDMELHGAPVDRDGYAATIERAKEMLVEVEKGIIEMLTPPCLVWRDKVFTPLNDEYLAWKQKYQDYKALNESMVVLTKDCGGDCDAHEHAETPRARRDRINEMNRRLKEIDPSPAKPKLETGPINLNSPQQVLGTLRELGYAIDGTSKEALSDFIEEHPQQAKEGKLADYLLYKKLAKLVQAFGDPVLERMREDGVGHIIQPSFNLMVSTGRMSCSEPNLQQVTKPLLIQGEMLDLRQHFRAPEGWVVGMADFSNIELRIAADLSGDERAIGDFMDGLDFHGRTAAVALGISYEEGQRLKAAHDHAFSEARNTGKIRNFATLYGAWDEEWREVFSTAYPRMWEWLEENGQRAVRQGYAQADDGFRKAFPLGPQPHPKLHWRGCLECIEWRKLKNRIVRQAKNFPIQSLSAAVTMAGAAAIRRELFLPLVDKYFDVPRFWNIVHDEYDLVIPERWGERVMCRVKEIAEREGQRFLKRVPVVVETSLGPCWAK